MGGPGAFIDLLVRDLMKHLSSEDLTETRKKENNSSESESVYSPHRKKYFNSVKNEKCLHSWVNYVETSIQS